MLEKYPQEVRVVFKNFPLRNHPFATKAAAAALGAQAHGKFWDFHDIVFENYSSISDQMVQDVALALGIDRAELVRIMTDPVIQSRIRQDVDDGRGAGVNGTPTVFVNGRLLNNRTLEGITNAIEQELKKPAG